MPTDLLLILLEFTTDALALAKPEQYTRILNNKKFALDICSLARQEQSPQWLKDAHANGLHGCSLTIKNCMLAIEHNCLDCLRYLHISGCAWDEIEFLTCIQHNRLDCLGYLNEHVHPWSQTEYNNAIKYGSIECLRYLHTNGCELDGISALQHGIAYQQYECLDYLVANGYDLYPMLYFVAASGCLGSMRYLYEHGIREPTDERYVGFTCRLAVMSGHNNCLRYAHENGFVIDEFVTQVARTFYESEDGNGYKACYDYLHFNGFIDDEFPPIENAVGLQATGPLI